MRHDIPLLTYILGTAYARTHLSTTTASISSTLTVVLPAGFTKYELELDALTVSTDGAQIYLTMSFDSGLTYASANYIWVLKFFDTGSFGVQSSNSDSKILISTVGGIGTGSGKHLSGIMTIINNSGVVSCPNIYQHCTLHDAGPHMLTCVMTGSLNGTAFAAGNKRATHLQFSTSTGTIDSGDIRLYGIV